MFDALNPPAIQLAGQPLSLQLNSSAAEFASLASRGRGWRVGMVQPDNSMVDLGLMAVWEVWPGVVNKWNMSVPGGFFQLVSWLHMLVVAMHSSICKD
jgi:hypothetical protein